jgi:hypothetical protein
MRSCTDQRGAQLVLTWVSRRMRARREPGYGKPSDVWAAGVVLAEMASGEQLFVERGAYSKAAYLSARLHASERASSSRALNPTRAGVDFNAVLNEIDAFCGIHCGHSVRVRHRAVDSGRT